MKLQPCSAEQAGDHQLCLCAVAGGWRAGRLCWQPERSPKSPRAEQNNYLCHQHAKVTHWSPLVSRVASMKIQKNPTQHTPQIGVTTIFSLQPHIQKWSPALKGSSYAEAVNEVKSPLFISPSVKGWPQSRGVSTSKKERAQVAVGSFWGSDGSWATFKEEQFNYYTLRKSEKDGALPPGTLLMV